MALTRWSEDPTRYGSLDPNQSRVIARGTVIPAARPDGRSQGFDHRVAAPVVVDPIGDEGYGVPIDFSKVTQAELDGAKKLAADPDDPSSVYAALAAIRGLPNVHPLTVQPIPPVAAPPPLPAPIAAATPEKVTPYSSSSLGYPMTTPLVPERVAIAPAAVPSLAAPASFQAAPSVDLSQQQYQQLLAEFQQLKAALSHGSALPGAPRVAAPPFVVEAPPAPASPFGIPFLTEEPQRPNVVVYFNLASAGTIATRYHGWYVDPRKQDCLVLVYDTRFEGGMQFLPTDQGVERPVEVVVDGKSWHCFCRGTHVEIGCLLLVMLILTDPPGGPPR